MGLPLTTILPLISMFFVFSLGIFVYFNDKKSKLNIIFFLFSVVIGIWLFGTFKMFTSNTDAESIFWDRFIYAGAVFVPTLMYHFSRVFCNIKAKKFLLILGYISSVVFLLLSRTDYFVSGLFRYPWGVHTQAKFLHNIFLIEFCFFLFLSIQNFYKYYKSGALGRAKKLQAKWVFIAFSILVVMGLPAYLPAYKISIFPFSYFSGLFFSVFLAYAILKHHLMNIRVVATEFFVGIIAFVLLVEILISETFSEIIFRSIIFLSFCFVGYLLIRSVQDEIKRRVELQRLYEEVEKLSKAKTEFLSIASHQLRTPLTAIKGYVSLVLEGTYGKLNEKTWEILDRVYKSNERLVKLINNLLNISRIESGKIELNPEDVRMEDVISDIIKELENEAKKKNLYLKWDVPKAALPKIRTDKEKIREVIFNVIDNAIKYTASGGAEITCEVLGDFLRIKIKDSGAGMTQEEIAGIFKSFARGETGTKIWTGGTGLGLYVAKKFVEIQHGKIWTESEGKDKGSTFFVELPIK